MGLHHFFWVLINSPDSFQVSHRLGPRHWLGHAAAAWRGPATTRGAIVGGVAPVPWISWMTWMDGEVGALDHGKYPLVIKHGCGKSSSLMGKSTINGDLPGICLSFQV